MYSAWKCIITIAVFTQSTSSDPNQFGNGNTLNDDNLRSRFFNGPQFGGGNNWLNSGNNPNNFNNQRQPGFIQFPTNNEGWNNNARPDFNNFGPQQYPGPNPNPTYGSPWNEDQGVPDQKYPSNNYPSSLNYGINAPKYPNNNQPTSVNYGINAPHGGRYPQDFHYPTWSPPPRSPNNFNPVQFLNNTMPQPSDRPDRPYDRPQRPFDKPYEPIDKPYRPIDIPVKKPIRPAGRPNRPISKPQRPTPKPTEKPLNDDDDYDYEEPVAIFGKPVIIPTTTFAPDQIFFRTKEKETAEQKRCVQDCPTTSEYNPICSSNNVTYFNPGRFKCARDCGIKVFIMLRGRCTLDAPFRTNL